MTEFQLIKAIFLAPLFWWSFLDHFDLAHGYRLGSEERAAAFISLSRIILWRNKL